MELNTGQMRTEDRDSKLPDAVSSCQNPVVGHQGPSTGVAPLSVVVELQRHLVRKTGALVTDKFQLTAPQHP